MINDEKNLTLPDVLMVTGEQCSYCGPMKIMLEEMKQDGLLAQLRFASIEKEPELARELGVRSVPWLQIGPFELIGSRSRQELLRWLSLASGEDGYREFLDQVLAEGDIGAARKLIDKQPAALDKLMDLLADADARINVRLGVGVIIEEIAESEMFRPFIPRLISLLDDTDARIRSDACHYLSLTRDASVTDAIEKLLSDEDEEVREIARESLDDLKVGEGSTS